MPHSELTRKSHTDILRTTNATVGLMAKILTFSGHDFDLLRPDDTAWSIIDIAHGLSNLCRFAGHTTEFYSVAQHCVVMSRHVPRSLALTALFHDAAEAFVGDMPTPLKALLEEYRMIETRIQAAILRRLGLPETLPLEIKRADRALLATERRDLLPCGASPWPELAGVEPLAERIVPLPPAEARAAFLARAVELLGEEEVGRTLRGSS